MPLDQADLEAIGQLIEQRVNSARFGGPTAQVAPPDLVYLGHGRYVSQGTGRMYGKAEGRLIDHGPIPEPV